MNSLQQNGYTTTPIYSLDELSKIETELKTTVSNFQEFKPDTTQFVLGGFSGLGNPSSFHNPLVRKIRTHIHPLAIDQVFKPINTNNRNLEQIICRLMIRPPKAAPSKESWHRDISPNTLPTDTIFGGWVNLSCKDQFFSCIRGSHLDTPTNGRQGFATIKDKGLIKQYNQSQLKTKVRIPPGHLLVFAETIIHEVVSNRVSHTVLRLHIGWRLTNQTTPLITNIDQLLIDQSVVPLKSLQIPPMYAILHWTNWRSKIVDFSVNMDERCLVDRVVGSGQFSGKSYNIVDRHMKSLREYKYNLYPNYTLEEINILKPHSIN